MATSSPHHLEGSATEEDDSGGSIKTSGESPTDNDGVITITSTSWIEVPSLDASPTSAPGAKIIPLELDDATLGENTQFATAGGIDAMQVPHHMLLYWLILTRV
jgi:hypothetical protein